MWEMSVHMGNVYACGKHLCVWEMSMHSGCAWFMTTSDLGGVVCHKVLMSSQDTGIVEVAPGYCHLHQRQ